MFKIYNYDDQMVAYGESQRAAFCARHEDGVIHWMGFEFERVQKRDIPVILSLATLVQSCHEQVMYLCPNQDGNLIKLTDEVGFKHFLEDKYCR